MWWTQKIKAGALQYVLVVAVIIVIVLFAFISLLYLQKKIHIKNTFYKETIANVNFGFDYLTKENLPYNTPKEYQFTENPLEKTTLLKKHWGVFDIGIIRSTIKNETFQKIGLLGHQYSKRTAIYLKENNTALVLVGDTKITGNAVLPKQGVKRGNIAGTSYNGTKLIYGTVQRSTSNLPIIKNKKYLKTLFSNNFLNDSILAFELEEEMKITQSFNKKTLLYQTNGVLNLRNIQLQGNIILQSTSKIIIAASAIINDVILIAPSIEIQSNVHGNFQAFASKKIVVQENCDLSYPTALLLFDKTTSETTISSEIRIGKKSTVKGIVVFYSEKKTTNYKPQLFIDEKAIVTGEVYCTQNLELLGSVYGSVTTNSFIANQFGSIYINHIYNGRINAKKLPVQYSGLPIGNTSQKVAKWLY